MSKRLVRILAAAAVVSTAVAGSQVVARASAPHALVKTAAARILVNGQGMTLYVFTVDKPNKSECYGVCAKYWPPLLVPKGMKAPAAMAGIMGKFGVTMRTGGAHQLTYDGAPLYTFASDKKPGDMNGQGFQGTWWVVVTSSGM